MGGTVFLCFNRKREVWGQQGVKSDFPMKHEYLWFLFSDMDDFSYKTTVIWKTVELPARRWSLLRATIKAFTKWRISNRVALFSSANDAINHAGRWMCHTPEQHILYISTSHDFPLSHWPCFLLCSRNISRQLLQDNGAQLPRATSPVALTNVASTEQETLCSHIRVKYLLFISAKAKEGKRNATMEKVELIAEGGWRHCEKFHDNRTRGFGSGLLQYSDTEKCKSNISEWEGAAGWAINLSVKNGARTVTGMCSVMMWDGSQVQLRKT